MTDERYRTAATLSGMRAMSDNRFLGRFRSRPWRRALILFITVSWTVTLVGWITPPGLVPEWLWLGPIIPMLVAIVVLVLATRNLSSSVDAFADERDRTVRDRATRVGYWLLGPALGAFMGLAHSVMRRGTEDGVVTLSAGEASTLAALAMTVILLYAMLPTAVLGWAEPDLPEDEEEE